MISERMTSAVTGTRVRKDLIHAIGSELYLERQYHQRLARKDIVAKTQYINGTGTLARYEKGERSMPIEAFVELCDVLGVTVEDLLDRARSRMGVTACPTCGRK